MLFFKVGIRLLTKMEAILKHYCVFHTAIVNFYEIFISLTRKYHKISDALLSNPCGYYELSNMVRVLN